MKTINIIVIVLFTGLLAFVVSKIFKHLRAKSNLVGWFAFAAGTSILLMCYFAFMYNYVVQVTQGSLSRALRGFTYNTFLVFVGISLFLVPLTFLVFIITRILKTK